MDGTTDQTTASPFATPNPPIPADARHLDDAPSISGRDPPSDWIVVDADRQSIHLFSPEMRATYDLDTVWQRRLFRHGQHLADIDESVQLTEEEEEKQAEQ